MSDSTAALVPAATEIPFRLAGGDNPLILFPVSIDTQPGEFILDTGAGITVLSPELAQRLALPITGTKEGQGAAGKVTVSLATAGSVALGEVTQEQVAVAITDDLNRIGRTIGATVDGVIGYNVLHRFRVTVDYVRQLLRLESAPTPPRSDGIPFTLAHPQKPLVMVKALVDGQGPFPFAVDTGASTTVLSTELAGRLGIESVLTDPLTGAGGQTSSSAARIDSLQIGEQRLDGMQVAVAGFLTVLSQALETPVDGIVGYNFLKEFTVTIDYPAEKLVLELRR